MNSTHFDRYARILVEHGAGLREGQDLYVNGEVAHRELALRIGELGYDLGAGTVSYMLGDPQQKAQLIRRGRLESIDMAHQREMLWMNEVVARRGAIISLRADEDPRLLPGVAEEHPDRHAIFTRSANRKGKVFLNHGINRALCPWVVAGVVTPAWAQQVFPDLETGDAVERLWQLIFEFTYADREDAVEQAAAKDRRLHARRRLLDDLQIREVHITGGGSDLRVGLSERARWLGGSKETAFGQTFNANIPTEENFTTPDRGHTQGTLAASMPFRTKSGVLVEGLVMHFDKGQMVEFTADRGSDEFRRWVDSDAGARYLGELALVGQDSAIARSGLFFEHTLFDENASVHVAFGQAYTTALEGGENLSARELSEIGCNLSSIHTDVMVGSPEVSVIATRSAEGEVMLIDHGHWTERFLAPARQAVARIAGTAHDPEIINSGRTGP